MSGNGGARMVFDQCQKEKKSIETLKWHTITNQTLMKHQALTTMVSRQETVTLPLID